MSRKMITEGSLLGVVSVLEQKTSEDSPLWSFATALYADAAVARAALAAQDDAGMDVNLLLFAAWLATRDTALDHDLLERAEARCDAWRREVVHPLRSLRRRWKAAPPHDEAYAAVKAVELAAERRQLEFLETLPFTGHPGTLCAALLRRNMGALAAFCGVAPAVLAEFEKAVVAALPGR